MMDIELWLKLNQAHIEARTEVSNLTIASNRFINIDVD